MSTPASIRYTITNVLTPIAHNQGLSRSRPSFSKKTLAKPPKSETEVRGDLVEITGGTSKSALKYAAKNAGEFFLKSLPLAGAALAGPPGLLAGALLSGTSTVLLSESPKTGKKLRAGLTTALVSSVVAGVTSLAGPAAPALQMGLSALGSLVAGKLEYSGRTKSPDFHIKLPKLARQYHQAVEQKLKEEGKSLEGLGKAPGFRFSKKAAHKEAQIHLAKTALLAHHHLGAAAALAIASELGKKGVDPEPLSKLAKQAHGSQIPSTMTDNGVEILYKDGLKRFEKTDGYAIQNLVYLDSSYAQDEANPRADFVVGHEASHVLHRDSSSTLIENAVINAVDTTRRQTGNRKEILALNELQDSLELAKFEKSQSIELRADKEGLDYALERGHSREDILSAAEELFSDQPDTESKYREHPSRSTRLQALREHRTSKG